MRRDKLKKHMIISMAKDIEIDEGMMAEVNELVG